MKNLFNKELVMTKKEDEDLETSNKCWICDNVPVEDDVKVRDDCHITGKYTGSAHRDCNINVKLNHRIFIVFHNLKNYDSQLIIKEPDKLNLKKKIHTKWIRKTYDL